MVTIFNFCTASKYFRVTQNFFNKFNIYLYTTGIIFCKCVFLFCAYPKPCPENPPWSIPPGEFPAGSGLGFELGLG